MKKEFFCSCRPIWPPFRQLRDVSRYVSYKPAQELYGKVMLITKYVRPFVFKGKCYFI